MMLFRKLRQWLLFQQIHRANAYMDRAELAQASRLWKRIIAEAESLLGRDHVIAMTAREDLARCYFRLGDVPEAKIVMESALADLERVLGPEAEPTLNGLDSLGAIYGQLGDFEQAVQVGERAVSGLRAALGEDHHGYKRALENLLITYCRADDPAGQRQVLERMLGCEERRGDGEAADVVSLRKRLGRATREERAAALLSILSVETEPGTEVVQSDPLIARCIETLKIENAYHTRLSISDARGAQTDFRVDFSGPDRIRVLQRALDDDLTELFDEWIAIGDDHFQNVGVWIAAELSDERISLNRFLLSEKYLDLLRTPVARSSRGTAHDGRSFARIEFQSIPSSILPYMGEEVDLTQIDGRACVWIETDTARLAGAEVRFSYRGGEEPVRLALRQVFCAHGSAIEIEPPDDLTTLRPVS